MSCSSPNNEDTKTDNLRYCDVIAGASDLAFEVMQGLSFDVFFGSLKVALRLNENVARRVRCCLAFCEFLARPGQFLL